MPKLFAGYKDDCYFWFRIFGRGLVIKDRRKTRPLFSERYGYKHWIYLGNYAIRYLKPINFA
jgi:hypothetical protein